MASSRHLVDPALDEALAAFPPLEVSDVVLAPLRESIVERFAAIEHDLAVAVRSHTIAGPGGPLRVLEWRPAAATGQLPAVLHFHGGGYVMGVPELADPEHRRLVRERGVAFYSVEYRLAPETAYPGQLDDGYAALEWLHAEADALSVDRGRIGIKGESAGGGLAAALALAARDRGGPAIAFQLLTFPMLDDRTGCATDPHPYCGEFLWTGPSNRWAWGALLGGEPGGRDTPSHAAAARAANLAGLPPAYIAVGALDLFLDEDLDYARRLAHAGVPVELHVYPGTIHGFGLAPGSWIETNSGRDLADALRRFIAAPQRETAP